MRLSIRTKLAALLIIVSVIPGAVTLWLSMGTISRVADSSTRQASQALEAQAKETLSSSARQLALEDDLVLHRAWENAQALASYASALYDHPELYAGGRYWDAANHLTKREQGGWTSDADTPASVFVPPLTPLDSAVVGDLNIAAHLDFMADALNEKDAYQSLTHFTLDSGGILARVYPKSDLTLSSLFDARIQPYFMAAAPAANPGRATVFTQPYLDPLSNRGLLISAVSPVYTSKGTFIGVVSVDVNLQDLAETVVNRSSPAKGFAIIADPLARVVAASDEAMAELGLDKVLAKPTQVYFPSLLASSDENLRRVASNMLAGTGGVQELGQGSKSRLVAWAPVPSTGWTLIFFESKQAVLQPAAQMMEAAVRSKEVLLAQSAGETMVVAAGALILALLLGAAFTRPFQKLSEGARAIGQGNLAHRINLKSGDEAEELAQEFNAMAGRIQEISAGMEERVAARTREMAALYAVASATSHFLDLSSIMKEVLDQVTTVTGWEAGEIYIFEGQVGSVPDRLTERLPLPVADAIRSLAMSGYGEVRPRQASAGQGLYYYMLSVEDDLGLVTTLTDPDWPEDLAVFPVRSKGQSLGYLVLATRHRGRRDHLRPALIVSVASQLAVAIENFRLYEQAKQLAASEERSRLARELHDSVSQTLFSIALTAQAAATLNQTHPDKVTDLLARLSNLTAAAQNEMRDLIFALRPEALQNEGLLRALRRFMATVQLLGLDVTFEVEGEPAIGSEREYALYHFVREAVHNVVKHARAKRILVSLAFTGDRVSAEVVDDGVGFVLGEDGLPAPKLGPDGRPGRRGLGFSTMRERAASLGCKLIIETSPGTGTRLGLVPLGTPDEVRRGE